MTADATPVAEGLAQLRSDALAAVTDGLKLLDQAVAWTEQVDKVYGARDAVYEAILEALGIVEQSDVAAFRMVTAVHDGTYTASGVEVLNGIAHAIVNRFDAPAPGGGRWCSVGELETDDTPETATKAARAFLESPEWEKLR